MARDYVEHGRAAWASDAPNWGIWGVAEAELKVLPELDGTDVVELGCGTAYWSAWLARRGARPIGVDISERQLETARAFQQQFALEFPLVYASAEDVPLADELRPGLVGVRRRRVVRPLPLDSRSRPAPPRRWEARAHDERCPDDALLGWDEKVGDRLVWPQFRMRRFEWPELGSEVEFHLPHGEMIRLLRSTGFEVEDLIELQAPEDGSSGRWDFVTLEWARRWPSEEIWVARRAR
jgi:SAM-dependent methyltransferase